MGKKSPTVFVCQQCGYESPKYLGKCPSCGTWNQMVEEKLPSKNDSRSRVSISGKTSKAEAITDITIEKEERVKTELVEFNRVLGGGVVPGSLVLIGGDPGIGKSTLLLQVSAQLNNGGGTVLYVSGEESPSQIKMRAERLELRGTDFYLYAETDLSLIQGLLKTLNLIMSLLIQFRQCIILILIVLLAVSPKFENQLQH